MSSTSANGVPESAEVIGPLAATFLHVTHEFERVCGARFYDEETLTAAMLGGFAATLPLIAQTLGSGSEGEALDCSWGSYRKTRASDDKSEAASGADFAIILWESPEVFRLAIFQAKKGELFPQERRRSQIIDDPPKEAWWFDIHRRPNRPDDLGKKWRDAQLIVLEKTGQRFMGAKRRYEETLGNVALPEIGSNKISNKKAPDLTWMHYLVYRDDRPVCVPVSEIDKEVFDQERGDSCKENYVEILPNDGDGFFDLLRGGVFNHAHAGWLTIGAKEALPLLPDLLDLMPVYAGDDRSGRELQLDVIKAIHTCRAEASSKESINKLKALAAKSPSTKPSSYSPP